MVMRKKHQFKCYEKRKKKKKIGEFLDFILEQVFAELMQVQCDSST